MKKLSELNCACNLIDERVNSLIQDGWTHEDALSFIINYVSELSGIINSDKIDNPAIKGYGTQFDNLFDLSNIEDGSLISMTTNQVASLLYSDKDLSFDYAIIDEASKCRFEDIIISLPRIKHLVLIGDFMQLDPMCPEYGELSLEEKCVISKDKWEALNKSAFSLLLAEQVKLYENSGFGKSSNISIMKRQYRMNKGIFDIISPIYSIHKGFELIDEKQKSSNDVLCVNIEGTEKESGTSKKNEAEADSIARLMGELYNNAALYKNIKTVGIITGYKAQERLIKDKLRAISNNNKEISVQIGTFDRFQGREYDLVIISLVRTKRLGFTSNIRRMNVAFSRAKSHLIVYGNFDKLYEISLSGSSNENNDELNYNENEDKFVKKVLIPKLYSMRKTYLSTNDQVRSVINFIKEERNE